MLLNSDVDHGIGISILLLIARICRGLWNIWPPDHAIRCMEMSVGQFFRSSKRTLLKNSYSTLDTRIQD